MIGQTRWGQPVYNIVCKISELSQIYDDLLKVMDVSVDIETEGETEEDNLSFNKGDIIGISLAYNLDDKIKACYFPIKHNFNPSGQRDLLSINKIFNNMPIEPVIDLLRTIFSNKLIIGHNIKFDLKFLTNYDLPIPKMMYDTRVVFCLIDDAYIGDSSLKSIAKKHIEGAPIKTFKSFKGKLSEKPIEDVSEYSMNDSVFALMLKELTLGIINKDFTKLFYEIEMPVLKTMVEVEKRGVKLDLDYLKKLEKKLEPEIDGLGKECQRLAGMKININSDDQVKEFLYKTIKLDPIYKKAKRKSKAGKSIVRIQSVDSDSLKKLKDKIKNSNKNVADFLSALIRYRDLFKSYSTYITGFIDRALDGIMFTDYDSMGAKSGRFSSTPNLQNIPRNIEVDIRKSFISREGKSFIKADWGQIELRLMALLSKDPKLTQALLNGEDIHKKTAQEIFSKQEPTPDERYTGKTLNFTIGYGASEYGVSGYLKCDIKTAKNYIDLWFQAYQKVLEWKNKIVLEMERTGYSSTLYGRKRKIEIEAGYSNPYSIRAGINHVIQGTAADILKLTLIKLHIQLKKLFGDKAQIIMHVHDEIIVECDDDLLEQVKKEINKIMNFKMGSMKFVVNLDVVKNLSKKEE